MKFFLFSFLFLYAHCISSAFASSIEKSQVENPARLEQIAEHKIWRSLLHYFDTGLPSRNITSQVDDDKFFISPDGATDPLSELTTTFDIFKSKLHPDHQRFACQFPARFFWLKSQLPNQLPKMPKCAEFEAFREKINAQKVFLVFPAAYLNSPSSMFGHTFLRLKAGHRNNALLDYSINFAANANASENTLLYSIRGLTGGYPGQFSVVPYYDKIKEYSFLDSRDIWEYELKLNDTERAQLVRHTWELQNIQFDYYFLTENCSYRLVTLLAAISDRIDAAGEYRFRAVPTDTIRFLSKTPGFDEVSYRPSQVTKLRAAQSNIDDDNLNLIQEAVLDPDFDPKELLKLNHPKESLDLAYDYARYVAAKEKRNLPHLSERTLQLLSLRARQPRPQQPQSQQIGSNTLSIPVPAVRDDQGHDTLPLTIQMGHSDSGNFLNLGVRGAYHDLLDPPAGYPEGAQLLLFNLEMRHFFDLDESNQKRTQLRRFAFVDIFSNTPVDQFVKPRSWRVAFGLQYFDLEQTHGSFFEAGLGRTWQWHNLSLSALGSLNTGLFSDTGFLGAGPSLQMQYQQDTWSALIQTNLTGHLNREFEASWDHKIGVAKHFDGWQLRLLGRYQEFKGQEFKGNSHENLSTSHKEVSLGVRAYLP